MDPMEDFKSYKGFKSCCKVAAVFCYFGCTKSKTYSNGPHGRLSSLTKGSKFVAKSPQCFVILVAQNPKYTQMDPMEDFQVLQRVRKLSQSFVILVAHNTAAHPVNARGSSHSFSLIHSLSSLTDSDSQSYCSARIASSGIDSPDKQWLSVATITAIFLITPRIYHVYWYCYFLARDAGHGHWLLGKSGNHGRGPAQW